MTDGPIIASAERDTDLENTQTGPRGSADLLGEVVGRITYKEGWTFALDDIPRETEHLAGSRGLTLRITATVEDSYEPGSRTTVEHWFAVPPAAYDAPTWVRWVLDCVLLVEQHEALEFFRLDGKLTHPPAHGIGRNPYTIEAQRSRSQA